MVQESRIPIPEAVRLRYPFPTHETTNPVTATVATTVTQVARNNPKRVELLLVNLSANRGFIYFDTQVSTTRGIPVGADGGFVQLSWEEDGELVIREVWAINQNLAGTWLFLEVERV